MEYTLRPMKGGGVTVIVNGYGVTFPTLGQALAFLIVNGVTLHREHLSMAYALGVAS